MISGCASGLRIASRDDPRQALRGAESPFPPAADGPGTGSTETGGTTPPVQLTLDFEQRMDAGQRETHRMLNWLIERVGGLEDWLRSRLAGGRAPRSTKKQAEAELRDRGDRCLRAIRLLPFRERDKLLERCSQARFGAPEHGTNIEQGLARGTEQTVIAVEGVLFKRTK